MANESSYGTIAAVVNGIWERVLFSSAEQTIMPNLVRGFTDSNSSVDRKWATYSGGTVQTITEATDMSAQVLTASVSGTLSVTQFGMAYFLTDQRINSQPEDAMNDASFDMAQKLSVKVDGDLLGNFSSFTGGTVGTAGGTLTWANIMRASAYLRSAYAPFPHVCVIRPEHWYYLASASSVPALVQAPELMNSMFRNFYVGGYGGIQIFLDANITSGTAAVGGMFSREAIAYDLRRALRIEPQRDASRGGGGWELNATMIYAQGVYRPTFGVKIVGTSA